MLGEKRRIGDILIHKGVISQEQLQEALDVQRLTPAPLGSILAHLGFIDEDSLVACLAQEYSVKPWNLKTQAPDPLAIAKVSADVAKSYRVLPVALRGETLLLAMSNPEDVEAIDIVQYTSKLKVEPVLAARHRLLQTIERYYAVPKAGEVPQAIDIAPNFKKRVESVTGSIAETIPIITLVSQVLQEGVRAGATDTHFEPTDDHIDIKYRIDGMLRTVNELPITLLQPLVIRMKILAGLEVGETPTPLEARITTTVDERKVDLRLSIMPSHRGSRMVLRVLEGAKGIRPIDQLGFSDANLALFKHLANRPYGLLLISGPSGSGKTATLYSTLASFAHSQRNVMSCEDPIEVTVPGICQSQIDEGLGLTYPTQLGAMMRQDPDVIVIGEIRDNETAQAVTRAALSGHLVISTIQANDAPSAIGRLSEFGVDAYHISMALAGVTAQRLIRTLCPICKQSAPIQPEQSHIFDVYCIEKPDRVYLPKGCSACADTGFVGRSAIHEILPCTSDIAQLITEHASAGKLRQAGMESSFTPMQAQALEMVAKGVATFEDAQRIVALDPDYAKFVQTTEAAMGVK